MKSEKNSMDSLHSKDFPSPFLGNYTTNDYMADAEEKGQCVENSA